eukprot:12908693-Prorocentrum_lima.AAC.1
MSNKITRRKTWNPNYPKMRLARLSSLLIMSHVSLTSYFQNQLRTFVHRLLQSIGVPRHTWQTW